MQKSTTLILAFLFLISTGLSAQTPSIYGQVIDNNSQPVSYATVILFNHADSAMVKAMASDEHGNYSFSRVKAGKYSIGTSFIGYEDYRSEAFVYDGNSSMKITTITMSEMAERLDNVVVEAKRPIVEVKPDKTVFNVEGSINAQGNNALELLRKSPGVVVDNNENLVLQGKSGVVVYIDGKRSPLSADDLAVYLKNLQSNQVDAIEVITNPSAKYDAEGNAGIINIRLIKDKNLGTNGTVNLGYRYGQNSRYNGSLNFNHRNRHYNSYGSYSYYDGVNESDFWLVRELTGNSYDQVNKIFEDRTSHGFRFGTDFFLNKNSTIGFLVNGNINDNSNKGRSFTEIAELSDMVTDSLLVASNDNIGERNNTNFNINYAWSNKDGKSITVDLDHGRFRNMGTSFQPNTYFLPDGTTVLSERTFSNVTPTDIDIYTAKFDYETKFMGGNFGTGVKSTNIRTNNTFDNFDIIEGVSTRNIDRSNNFVYKERVNAAYVSWQKQMNDKWNVMFGLRTEHTNSTGDLTSEKQTDNENVERNYLDFFPSGGVTYKYNEKNNFRLNYSRRIDRPNYQDLNPFEWKLDELSFQKGNPFLRPQYSESVALTHTYKSTLSTTLNYTVITDVSTRITEALDEKSAILTFVNLASQSNLALTISYPFSLAPWWNVYATVTGYRLHNKANIEGDIIDLKTHAMNFYAQNTFSLPKGFRFELSGWYNSPAIWAGNWTTNTQYDVTAGISKQFMQKRANLKVSVSDIFFKNGWGGQSQFGELSMRGGGTWESRQLRFNFSYSFGNNQVKSSRRRKTGMEEEGKRAGG